MAGAEGDEERKSVIRVPSATRQIWTMSCWLPQLKGRLHIARSCWRWPWQVKLVMEDTSNKIFFLSRSNCRRWNLSRCRFSSLFTVDFHLFFRRSCLKAKLKRVGYWRQSESKRNEKRTPDIASPSASAWLIWSLLILRYFLSKTHHSSSLTPRGKPGYIRKQSGRRASAAIYVYYHPPSSLL